MNSEEIIRKLKDAGLRITPQRVLILETVSRLDSHPTAEEIFKHAKSSLPNIAVGTVYNILESLIKKGLVEKICSSGDKMRYDIVSGGHHHLLSRQTEQIGDYFNRELSGMISRYLVENEIPGFRVSGFKLNILGEFVHKK